MSRVWTSDKDALLRRLYPDGHLGSLAFRLGVSLCALKSRARILGVRRVVNVKHFWTSSEVDYLVANYGDVPVPDLVVGTGHSAKAIRNKARSLGLRRSRSYLQAAGRICSQHPRSIATRFVKGCAPANKGKRIEEYMSADGIARSSEYRFRRGHRPYNCKPVGYERCYSDGYIYVKVCDGRRMVQKHRYIWEQANGPVPSGHCVCFRDGDTHNCELSNLFLLSRAENGRRRSVSETPEQRRQRIAKASETRNRNIRRDKVRIHWGMDPLGNVVKKW